MQVRKFVNPFNAISGIAGAVREFPLHAANRVVDAIANVKVLPEVTDVRLEVNNGARILTFKAFVNGSPVEYRLRETNPNIEKPSYRAHTLDPNDPSGAWDVSLFDIEELLAARAILQGGGGLVTSIRNVPEAAIPQICTGVITNALADKHLPLIAMGLTTGIS